MKRIEVENITSSESNIYNSGNLVAQYFPRPLHTHQEVEIILIEQGDGVCFAGDSITSFSSGDIFLFNSRLPHFFKSAACYYDEKQNLTSASKFVQFKTSVFPSDYLSIPIFKNLRRLLQDGAWGLKWSGNENRSLIEEIREMMNHSGILRFTKLFELLDNMSSRNSLYERISSDASAHIQFSHNRIYRKVLEYISINFQKVVTLDEIAIYSGMNSSALCRHFKQISGESIFTYLINFRVTYAKNMLSTTEQYISTIAYESGFTTLPNFNAHFKRAVGCTPSEYRSRLKI